METTKGGEEEQREVPGHPCPMPDRCPFGAKAAGYVCGSAFELWHGEPGEPGRWMEHVCTFCWGHEMGFRAFIAEQNRRAKGTPILVAQQAPPPIQMPGNNGRGVRGGH